VDSEKKAVTGPKLASKARFTVTAAKSKRTVCVNERRDRASAERT
jgi:hypothetical protein